MSDRIIQVPIGLAFVVLVCISGCGQDSTVYGTSASCVKWNTKRTDLNSTPGIDSASVTQITLKAGPPVGVQFVVWSDSRNGCFISGSTIGCFTSGSGDGRASYKGQLIGEDDHRLEIYAETTNGRTGTIKIADVTYKSANGSLLLVSTQHDPPQITQIALEEANFHQDKDRLIKLAKSNADIRAFWEKCKNSKEGKQDR